MLMVALAGLLLAPPKRASSRELDACQRSVERLAKENVALQKKLDELLGRSGAASQPGGEALPAVRALASAVDTTGYLEFKGLLADAKVKLEAAPRGAYRDALTRILNEFAAIEMVWSKKVTEGADVLLDRQLVAALDAYPNLFVDVRGHLEGERTRSGKSAPTRPYREVSDLLPYMITKAKADVAALSVERPAVVKAEPTPR